MKRKLETLIGLLFLAGSLAAQDNLAPKPRVLAAPVDTLTVAAGKSTRVELPFRVQPGFHINSHRPTSDLLVPTVINFDPPTNLAVADVSYPSGHDMSFSFSPKDKLNVYTGDFTVSALVRAATNTPRGTYRVRGHLKYQACDDKACYPPTQVPLAFDVHVARAPSTRHRRNPRQSPLPR